MKDTFVWYVDAERPHKGHQSNHVATVVIIRGFMVNNLPYFRIGVAVKHQKDGLPFIKTEGRRLALDRAQQCAPIFKLGELRNQVRETLCREVRDPNVLFFINGRRLESRIEYVLSKFLCKREES